MNQIISILSFVTPARGINFNVCILFETTSSVNNATETYASYHVIFIQSSLSHTGYLDIAKNAGGVRVGQIQGYDSA